MEILDNPQPHVNYTNIKYLPVLTDYTYGAKEDKKI